MGFPRISFREIAVGSYRDGVLFTFRPTPMLTMAAWFFGVINSESMPASLRTPKRMSFGHFTVTDRSHCRLITRVNTTDARKLRRLHR